MGIGIGMAISGACPGIVWVQIGSGVENSFVTLAGCFVGALVHGLIHPFIIEKNFCKQHFAQFVDLFLKKPYPVICIFCGFGFWFVGILLGMLYCCNFVMFVFVVVM